MNATTALKYAKKVLADLDDPHCPACNAQGLHYGEFQVQEGRLYQRIACPGCGLVWHVGYTADSVAFDQPDGTKTDFVYPQEPIRLTQEDLAGLKALARIKDGEQALRAWLLKQGVSDAQARKATKMVLDGVVPFDEKTQRFVIEK